MVQDVINASREEQLTTQWALNIGMGMGGSQAFIDGDDSSSGNTYFALQVIRDATLTSLSSAYGTGISKIEDVELPAGLVLYGEFTDVVVDSGIVCGYMK